MAAAASIALGNYPAAAQTDLSKLPIIRDAEIEQLLRDYSQPILRVAGLGNQNVNVVIINNRTFNAFVADGHRIFINAGTLLESQTPNQVIGVLAHETGHIDGGHLAKMRQEIANECTIAIAAALLGVGALIAASQSGGTGTGMGQAGAAMLSAPQSIIQHTLLSYQRAQEDQADRSGVKFLTESHQSPKGMYETFKHLADESLFSAHDVDPYRQSHPMPRERVAALEGLAKSSPYWEVKDPPTLQERHNMMRAKLAGFLDRPETVLRRYPMTDQSLPARYARAISSYRFGDPRRAAAEIDALIAVQPQNPYFYELKGQALLEGGHPNEAIPPLRRAVALSHNTPLIEILLGQALLAANNPKYADEAISILRTAAMRESEAPDLYTQLAIGYGKKGDLAYADLSSATAASLRGDFRTARQLATRARGGFPIGSPGWVKADDIANFKPPAGPRGRPN
jgi:predicted Zn-dependent protease